MSQSYAARLSEYKNKGVCGLPENQESHRVTNIKIKKLAKLLVEAKNVVIITGAGISTGAGIPDFRGPKGVWTQERERKKQEALKKKEEAKKKKHVKRKISKSNDFSASKRSKVDDMSDVITGAAAAAAAVAAAAAAVANLCNDASTSESSTSCTPTKTANTDDEESSDDGKQQPPQSSGPRRQSPRLASKTSQATVLENFADARPTLCHRAITKLVRERRVHYCTFCIVVLFCSTSWRHWIYFSPSTPIVLPLIKNQRLNQVLHKMLMDSTVDPAYLATIMLPFTDVCAPKNANPVEPNFFTILMGVA